MTRGQRRIHLVVWVVLAGLLGVGIVFGLSARPAPPAHSPSREANP